MPTAKATPSSTPSASSFLSASEASPASTSTSAWPELRAHAALKLEKKGQSPFKFLGLTIYETMLWAPNDRPLRDVAQAYADAPAGSERKRVPTALSLTYSRKLEGPLIAERSLMEMQRLGSVTPAQAQAWLQLMKEAFPNVGPGDRLSGVHDGQGRVFFYFNGKPTAQIDSAEFAHLFFGIWLHPKTSAASLRKALLADAA